MHTFDQQKLQPFLPLELIARQVVEGFITGLHKSPFHGFSVEFAEHRIYNAGESTRNIDWKLFGRTDKLFVKRFEEETNLRCQIVIDNSSSMYFPSGQEVHSKGHSKVTFSVYAAAALIQLLKKQRDAVGLTLFSDQLEIHTETKSTLVHHRHLFSQLENILSAIPQQKLKKRTAAIEAIHRVAEKVHKRSLIVIFTDMVDNERGLDDLFSALQHLKHHKHEVILFYVYDGHLEMDFEFENRPYRLVDMESGEEIKLHPAEIKDAYKSAISKFKKDILLKCGQYGVDFIEADVNKGFKQVLLPYLLKRTRMQ